MDLIVVEPLNLAPPTSLVSYGTFEDETPAVEAIQFEQRQE